MPKETSSTEAEQPWSPPTWEQVAPRFQEAFPDIEPDEIRRRYESARELGLQRYRMRGAEETGLTAFLRSTDPFGVLAGRNASALRQASERFAQGRAQPGDAETIAVQERLQELDQNRSTASSIGRAILGSATYGAEYMAGGALLRGASGLVRGGSALANPSAANAIGGMVGRSAALAAPHVWSETEQRRVPEIQRDETGRAVGLPTQETSRTFWNALPAGAFDAFTEAFTEQLGGTKAFQAIGRVPGALLDRVGLGRARNFISAGVTQRLARAGIHNPLAEMGEERAGELMRGLVLGDLMGERDTYGATGQLAGAARSAVRGEGQAAQQQAGQALRQLFIEGAAFSIIQGGAHGLGHIMNARSGPEAALRAQIEAEVQRQQATNRPQTSPASSQVQAQPQQAGVAAVEARLQQEMAERAARNPDLAAAEAQINQRLSGHETPQVQEPQGQAQPEQEQAPEAAAQSAPETPVAPSTAPGATNVETPVQAPQDAPAGQSGASLELLRSLVEIHGERPQGARESEADFRARTEPAFERLYGREKMGEMERMVAGEPLPPPTPADQPMPYADPTPEPVAPAELRSVPEPIAKAFEGAFPGSRQSESRAGVLRSESGGRWIEVAHDPARNSVRIDFGDDTKVGIPKGIQRGSVELMQRLQVLLKDLKGTGVSIEYVANEGRPKESTGRIGRVVRSRYEQYAKLLKNAGYEQVSGPTGQGGELRTWKVPLLERMKTVGLRGVVAAKAVAQAAKAIQPGVKEFKQPPAETRVALTKQEEIGLAWYRTGEEGGLRTIADAHGVSHETVRGWAKKALNKLGQKYENVKEQESLGQASRLSDAQEVLTAAERGEDSWIDDDKAPIQPVVAESGLSPEELIALTKGRTRKYSDYAEKQEAIQNKILKEIANAKRSGRQVPQKRIEAYLAELAELESQAGRSSEGEDQESGEVSEETGAFGQPVSAAERTAGSISGGQENAAGATRTPRVTALANVVTRAERVANELPPIEQAARLEDAAVWDEAMERLREDPQASVRLVEELNKKPRATTVQENALLAHRRVSLANEHERAALAYIAESRKLKQADPAKLNELEVRERWLLDQIDQADKAIVKSGTEWGRSGRWRRMLIAEDFTPAGMRLRAEAAKGRPLTADEKKEVLELNRKIAELQKQLDEAIKAGKTKPGEPSDTDFELKKLQGKFARGLKEDRQARDPWTVKARRIAGEAVSIPKSLMASIDFPLLRQGMIASLSHPIRTAKGIPEMVKSFFSENVAERALYDIQHRPNAPLYEAAGLEITNRLGPLSAHEEGFMSRLMNWEPKNRLARIGLKIATFVPKASERAYQTTLNRIRADSFDAMASALSRNGELTTTEARVLANYANVMTGRGQIGVQGERALTLLNNVFFAPKWVASRFQMLLGQPLWTMQGGLAPRARLEVAKEYGRLLAGLTVVIGLAAAAGIDFEKDPRSTDWGKLKIGKTRLDLTGGLAGIGTFLARSAPVVGGVKTQDRSVRPQTERDIWGFVRQKLAPVPSAYFDLRTGRDAVGQRITPGQVGLQRVTPLFFNEVIETMQEQGVPKGPAIALLALMGMSTQTYKPR